MCRWRYAIQCDIGEHYTSCHCFYFFFQAEDGIRDVAVTGVQTCALPICDPVCPPLPFATQINEKYVQAIGYVPDAINPIAIKKITVVVTRLKWIDPVCADRKSVV